MRVIEVGAIASVVAAYLARHPDDADRIRVLTSALTASGDLTSRVTLPGHVTCSALVLDPAGRVLHILHRTLNRWLRPGGHLEAGDADLVSAALREVAEETGIDSSQLALLDEVPIDIDVHPIPANPVKREPGHLHFDLCYAFAAAETPTVTLQINEVRDFVWLPLDQLQPETIRSRVLGIQAERVAAGPWSMY